MSRSSDRRRFQIIYTLDWSEERPSTITVPLAYVTRAAAKRIAEVTAGSPMDRIKLGEHWVSPSEIRSWRVSSIGA